ncbi:MAG: molybdopterin-dependent oxidoreductase [Pseudomonadales bacterium]|nr:molybdopterin-dependent oxidoreductase [Pseudomonadales bacterium]
MSTLNYSRRNFLRTTGIAGGGLVVGFSLSGCSSSTLPLQPVADAYAPNAFLQLTPENVIRFYCPRDEMGQGVTTGLATCVAEELDIDPANLLIELAGAHSDYGNPDFGGMQGTGGSTSIKAHYTQLRQVGADTRALLLNAAAADLGVSVTSLSTENGHVVANGERHPYGQFIGTAAGLEVPAETPLKSDNDFNYIGKDFPRLDGISKSTGTATYGIDVDIPGMHHAVVKRSPVAGGTVASFDGSSALAMNGVTDVVEIASGVAVVAEKFWQAKQAVAVLEVQWDLPELSSVDSAKVRADYEQLMDSSEGESAESAGELETGFAGAQDVIEQRYWAPYLAHAPMEPMNAVINIEGDKAELWSGTQGPGIAQGLVARYAGLDKENVTVHQTYLGGAFGRRGTLTHIIEATQVALEAKKPIHLLWTREDDIKSGVYRPASLMNIRAGLGDDGKILAWQAKRVGGNITPGTLRAALPGVMPTAISNGVVDWVVGLSSDAFDGWVVDHSSIEGLYEDYDLPNREVLHVTKNHGVPLTFWRSVGHSFTAFAKESLVDELVGQSGLDAVEFRLRNTENNPRLHNVIKIAGERMRAMRPETGRYLGFAAHGSFSSYVAEVAEISIENDQIRVHNVLCVVDCRVAVNPDIVVAQMEGAVMYGLTAALHGDLNLVEGVFKESNFHDYPILRMNEAPNIEVVIVDSNEAPTGVGEPGLPPIAPAVANAVFAASGQRLRSLPLRLA